MGVRINKSGKHKSPTKIDNVRVARFLLDLITRSDDVDLSIANEQSAVANDSKLGQFLADARTFRARQRDQLRGVKKS